MAVEMNTVSRERIPVTLLTGFLGAGKTTLLNHILSANHGHKIAVIVNEFGEVGVDNKLVVGADEEIFEMNNGCICCTVRGDLIRILGELRDARIGKNGRKVDFDRVLIETTGLADPAPVIQTFYVDQEVDDAYSLDAVVTVVDAKHAEQHLDDGHEAQEQVAFADVLLLNKIDLASEDEVKSLENRLRSMNPYARIYRTEKSNIETEKILGINAFDISKKLEIDPGFLEEEDHEHDNSVTSIVLREEKPLDLRKVEKWLFGWLTTHGADVFRYKGFLYINNVKQRVLIQGVHMLFESAGDRPWKDGEEKISELVLIGRNLDSSWFQKGFEECVAH
ncbi:GTP-binding protein [Alicyclobacillus fastidiosus]|uniref:GTP-binding protein n=1 Tax=Alicyclobacillus fastidiosus TaxID=392011 RepID=A0ABY6ZLL3_9BACL|nr:GTP-binding protein [Alicyclobacillus fastidiosus]WAH43473.1 GTP-binding protein [Alicyclobacillus fastidiosus]GMA59631.1 cobalamin biosynthesis protein CobW [Alicyclobacillus fastidiosus]